MSRMPAYFELSGPARDDDEGLFSRDVNGQLIRLDTPTESDYSKTVTLKIDDQTITVPLCEPLKDAQGNIVLDLDGRTTPRYTTIYDAAWKLYVKEPGDEAKLPIPVLCHQPHMTPVAVCRVCVVQIYGQKRGRRAPERKLLPACQHPVKQGMEVYTLAAPVKNGEINKDAQTVSQAVRVLAELLVGEHLKPPVPPAPAELSEFNELQQLADRFEITKSRFSNFNGRPVARTHGASAQPHHVLDDSSRVFLVDHSACILCDRCSRACDEVKKNNVIGRTGKGASAAMGFDLDDPIGKSSCVQCGECMVSCPTTAITFKPIEKVRIGDEDR